jgi:hypothetical protein
MLLVEIEKPGNEPLSIWFTALRDWLDANCCTPAIFMRSGRLIDRLIYRVSFDDTTLAHRFVREFARYSPSVRRATSYERDQLRALNANTTEAVAE